MAADDVHVDGTDLDTYDFKLTTLPNIRGFHRRYHTATPLLGAPVRLDYAPIYEPRRFDIGGILGADGTSELHDRIETIENLWAGATEKKLEFPNMRDGYWMSTLEGITTSRVRGRDWGVGSSDRAATRLTLHVLCADPFRYIDLSDVTSSSGTEQDIDLGTAPTRRWTVEFTVAANTRSAGFYINNTSGDRVFTFDLDTTPTTSVDVELDMYDGSVTGDVELSDVDPDSTFPIVLDPLRLGSTPSIEGKRSSGGSIPSVTASVSAAYLG